MVSFFFFFPCLLEGVKNKPILRAQEGAVWLLLIIYLSLVSVWASVGFQYEKVSQLISFLFYLFVSLLFLPEMNITAYKDK